MNFSERRTTPLPRFAGIVSVILFHALIIYALVTGLAKKVVDVVRTPVETKVIEEVRKPPPPPEAVVPPPPKFEAPPPPFIPPPEVQIQAPPPPVQNTITAQVTAPPPPQEFRPMPPPTAPAPVPAPAPVVPPSTGVACPRYHDVLVEAGVPREALRAGLEKGSVIIEFTVTGTGQVKDVEVVSSSHRAFNRGAIEAVKRFECKGPGHDVRLTVPIDYSIN